MDTINVINVGGIDKEIEDSVARASGESADSRLDTLEPKVTNEITNRTNADASLQSQIDQIVAPTGTAPNPAEIENARITVDNEIKTTLGESIRSQIQETLLHNLAGSTQLEGGSQIDLYSLDVGSYYYNGAGPWDFVNIPKEIEELNSAFRLEIFTRSGSESKIAVMFTTDYNTSKWGYIFFNYRKYGDGWTGWRRLEDANSIKNTEMHQITAWTQGGIGASGVQNDATYLLRSSGFIRFNFTNSYKVFAIVPPGYKVLHREYTDAATSTFVNPDYDTKNAFFEPFTVWNGVPNYYYRLVLSREDDSDITPAQAPEVYVVAIDNHSLFYKVLFEENDIELPGIDSRIGIKEFKDFEVVLGGIGGTGSDTENVNRSKTSFKIPFDSVSKIAVDNEGYEMELAILGSEYKQDIYQSRFHGLSLISSDMYPYVDASYLNTMGDSDSFRIVISTPTADVDLTDKLDEIKKRFHIYTKTRVEKIPYELEVDNIATAGYYQKNNTRARSKALLEKRDKTIILFDKSKYKISTKSFTEGLKFVESIDWIDTGIYVLDNIYADLFYLTVKKNDGSDITIADLADMEASINVFSYGESKIKPYKYGIELSTPAMLQSIADSENHAPTLCSIKFKNESNKHPVPIGYLYHDDVSPYKFYYSPDGVTLNHIFDWDATVTDTGSRTPMEYSFGITSDGDILCVYRGDLAYALGLSVVRQNPIVYPHSDYTHPVMVDFGNDDAPTAWLQSCGYYAEDNRIFMCEYTRFTHTYAHVWKAVPPYTNKSNWTILKSFQVSGASNGFKHCHNIERDPFTGILWLTTGDRPPAEGETLVGTPGIYYSTNDGSTWTTLLEGSEKYCRQLNFVWLEDYVYWASDSSDPANHYLIRAKRDANGVIDLNTIEDLFKFYTNAATYHLLYCKKNNSVICLDRYDGAEGCPINVYCWDINEGKMHIIAKLDGWRDSLNGFRVEAATHYPNQNGDEFMLGFGYTPNYFDIPGNRHLSRDEATTTARYAKSEANIVGCLNNMKLKLVEK